jgi:hypothetical protein
VVLQRYNRLRLYRAIKRRVQLPNDAAQIPYQQAQIKANKLRLHAGELSLNRGGVPVLPAFDETARIDTCNRSAGDMDRLPGRYVPEIRGPVHADAIVFSENDNGSDVKIGEPRARLILKREKLAGTTKVARAVVYNTVRVEQFGDGVAVALIPHFFEPADDKPLVALENRNGLAAGTWRASGRKYRASV